MSTQDGRVRIELDKPRAIKLDLNAMASFEDIMDMSIPYLLLQVQRAAMQDPIEATRVIGFRHVRALLWAGLLHEEPNLTLREAGNLVEKAPGGTAMDRMMYVQNKVMEAFGAAELPEDPNVPTAAQKNAPDDGTGRPSKKQPTARSA